MSKVIVAPAISVDGTISAPGVTHLHYEVIR
jgi:hypothetical protein